MVDTKLYSYHIDDVSILQRGGGTDVSVRITINIS